MAEDALNCITSLLESVPIWIEDLERILKTAARKQNEILFEQQPADSTPPVDATLPFLRKRASKSSSLRSKPSREEEDGRLEELEKTHSPAPTSQAPLLRPQLPHLTDSDALRLSQRKRKTASVCSGHQSGPSKYRSRGMVVVYYDGDIQKRFETLVRLIGTCRNGIRKGKMSAKVDSLSRTGSSSSEGSSSGVEDVVDLSKLGYTAGRLRSSNSVFNKNDGTQVFDKVDACLDKGQTLCERAAHQILRDGDCGLELRNAKKQLVEARTLAEAELPSLQQKVAKAAERQRRSNDRRRAKREAGESLREANSTDADTTGPSSMSSIPSDGKLEVDLEADESDGDGEDLVANTLQLGKYQMRSTRLLAH